MHPPLPDVLPVFPLPGLVLFPGTQLPLHIFEPRYREMLEAALSGDRMLVMALLQPGWEEQYYGAPPLHTVGCAARIVTAHGFGVATTITLLVGGLQLLALISTSSAL